MICIFFSADFSLAVKGYIISGDHAILTDAAKKHYGPLMYIIFTAIGFSLMAAAFCLVAFSDTIIIKSGTALTLTKMAIVAFLIGCGFFTFRSGYRPSVDNAWKQAITSGMPMSEIDPSKIASGLLTVFFAYDGFANLSTVITDLRNPRRDTLRAILAGVIIVSILYTGINVFYFFGLTNEEIKNAGLNLAALYASKIFMGDDESQNELERISRAEKSAIITKVVTCCIFLSAFGALLSISFAAARTIYVSGTMGNYLPFSQLLGRRNEKFGTPFNATVLQFVLGAVIFLLSLHPAINSALFNASMYCCYIFYTITSASLIYVRFRDKHIERPFRVFLGCPLLVVAVGAFMLVFPWFQKDIGKLVAPIFGVTSFLLGAIVYYFTIYRNF